MNDRLAWFREDRFGLMIHWGLYSLLGEGTWVMHHSQIPRREYARLADRFRPVAFDADEWARAARQCGARYMVFTSRHHDGYCLFDSAVSDFTSVRLGPGMDFVAAYVDACRRHGLKVGLYYSLLDWRFPGYFEPDRYPQSKEAMIEQAHAQLRELMSNYGRIDVLWLDGHWMHRRWDEWKSGCHQPLIDFWRAHELESMIRGLQPSIILNDRMAVPGDFRTVEQAVSAVEPQRGAWEVAQTIGDFWESWCDQRYTRNPSRKPGLQLIVQLIIIAARGGNLLLNVGPSHDGAIPRADLDRLDEIGGWLRVNGEAIYGTAPPPFPVFCSCGLATTRGNAVYLMLPCTPREQLTITGIGNGVERASVLGHGDALPFRRDASGRIIVERLPSPADRSDVPVLKLDLDDAPRAASVRDESGWIGA